MSGQWEVVGRKKDRTSKLPVAKTNNKQVETKKKSPLSGVNIEEVLAQSQVQNLYSTTNIKSNKENAKNSKEKPKIVDNNTGKKQQKKVEKPQEAPKPKPPKSIESALNSINVEEFKNFYEKIRLQYPDGQIIWLRELAQYLNQKIPIEVHDPIFSSKPSGYPFNVVPTPLKAVIQKSINDSGKIASVFFGISLTTMATEMSKGLSCLGYKIYLQAIAQNDSTILNTGTTSAVTLLNSYQNRPNIGLSILWAVGHVGLNNANAGLNVFNDFMFPLLEMKNYSRYVVKYLLDIINGLQDNSSGITKEEYLLILDTVYSNKKNFPNDLKQELINNIPKLKTFLFKGNGDSYKEMFNGLFKKLLSYNNKSYQNCLCEVLCEIFIREQSTLTVWENLYKNNLVASAILLSFIGNNYRNVCNKSNKKVYREFLKNLDDINEKLWQKKKKDDGLMDCVAAIQKINKEAAAEPKSSSGIGAKLFYGLLFCFALLVITDIKSSGSWEASDLRKITILTGGKVKEGLLWADGHLQNISPGYDHVIAEFSEPYVRLLRNLGLVICSTAENFKDLVVEKYPIVRQSIENYAPGVVEQSQIAVTNIWSTSILYVNRSVDYLKTEVFVGQLSPENVQRVVLEAFNTTQQKATEYYHWLYEKVQTSIK